MDREYLIRFFGPSPDESTRLALSSAGAPIVAEPDAFQNRLYGKRVHRVLVTAANEEQALAVVRQVLGPGNPGDYWDRFEVKAYENETAEQILAEDSTLQHSDRGRLDD